MAGVEPDRVLGMRGACAVPIAPALATAQFGSDPGVACLQDLLRHRLRAPMAAADGGIFMAGAAHRGIFPEGGTARITQFGEGALCAAVAHGEGRFHRPVAPFRAAATTSGASSWT